MLEAKLGVKGLKKELAKARERLRELESILTNKSRQRRTNIGLIGETTDHIKKPEIVLGIRPSRRSYRTRRK